MFPFSSKMLEKGCSVLALGEIQSSLTASHTLACYFTATEPSKILGRTKALQ